MSMAEMTQEEMVQEVLDRVLQSSTGVEDLETVTSLSGVTVSYTHLTLPTKRIV